MYCECWKMILCVSSVRLHEWWFLPEPSVNSCVEIWFFSAWVQQFLKVVSPYSHDSHETKKNRPKIREEGTTWHKSVQKKLSSIFLWSCCVKNRVVILCHVLNISTHRGCVKKCVCCGVLTRSSSWALPHFLLTDAFLCVHFALWEWKVSWLVTSASEMVVDDPCKYDWYCRSQTPF